MIKNKSNTSMMELNIAQIQKPFSMEWAILTMKILKSIPIIGIANKHHN